MRSGLDGDWAFRRALVGMSTGCYMLSDESLNSTPETNIALYVNKLKFKLKKKKENHSEYLSWVLRERRNHCGIGWSREDLGRTWNFRKPGRMDGVRKVK